jgi:hypothetical protein
MLNARQAFHAHALSGWRLDTTRPETESYRSIDRLWPSQSDILHAVDTQSIPSFTKPDTDPVTKIKVNTEHERAKVRVKRNETIEST